MSNCSAILLPDSLNHTIIKKKAKAITTKGVAVKPATLDIQKKKEVPYHDLVATPPEAHPSPTAGLDTGNKFQVDAQAMYTPTDISERKQAVVSE